MPPRKRNVAAASVADSDNGEKKEGVAAASPTTAPSPTQQRQQLPAFVRYFLVFTAIACFAFVAYDQYPQWSRTAQSFSPAAPPSSGQSGKHRQEQPQASPDADRAAKLQEERKKVMEQMKEEFEQWTPKPALPFFVPPKNLPSKPVKGADVPKRDAVKKAFQSSWAAYVDEAWGADEYHPISHTGSNLSVDGGIGYTIVDSLDSLLILGEQDEYRRARDWVKANLAGGLQKWERHGRYNVFETVIRTLGGLLSAHAFCSERPSNLPDTTSPFRHLCDPGDADMYLDTASHLANQLHPAFDTPTGIPKREVDFYTGDAFADEDSNGAASLAEATTVQLEFKYLSFRNSDPSLWKLAERPLQAVRTATRSGTQDGLLPILLSFDSGLFYLSPIRLGSRGDSYYEYLIKQYVQTNRSEQVYRDMFDRSVSGIKKHLVKQSTASAPPYLFTAEIIPQMRMQGQERPAFQLLPKQDHLVCFLPAAMMLGAHEYGAPSAWPELGEEATAMGKPTVREEDWAVGHELLRGCMATYQGTHTGLSPEIAHWRTMMDPQHAEEDWYIKQSKDGEPLIDARNILRPETVESLYVAFHLSGDPIYREWGWEVFQAFEKHCKLENGAYAGIKDVDPDDLEEVEHEDKMETFWLSETLKYLYLLFDDQATLPLDKWVLNTEAHPLPIFAPTQKTGVV